MTRDFAKKKRPAASPRKRQPPKSQVPGWVWLFTGAILGAFIMFLVYLAGIAPQSPADKPAPATAEQADAPAAVPKPRFDFYQLLKETEVVVQDPPPDTGRTGSTEEALEYILQVGSFKRDADADRLRAQLLLLNLDARVETVTVRNGETWHRVLVGPYESRSKVAKARSTLVSNNINPLLLKRKKG